MLESTKKTTDINGDVDGRRSIKIKKNIALLSPLFGVTALLGAGGVAQAQLTTYEGFNYPAATVLLNNTSSGNGWGLNWSIDGSSAQNGLIDSASLTNSINPLLATSGQALSLGNGVIYTRQLAGPLGTPGSATTVWVSLLYLGGTAASPNESRIGFYSGMGEGAVVDGNTTTSSSGTVQVVDLGKPASGNDEISLYVGANINSSGVATPRGSDAAFLLLKFDLSGNATADTVSLWVNPDISLGAGGLGTAQSTWTTVDLDLINGLRLQSGGAGAYKIDEIRLGKTFADVTPLAAPKLPIIQAGILGGNINLSWPEADGGGFILQSTTNVMPPVVWGDLSSTLTTNAGTISTDLPTTNAQTFFRLKK